jgi:hypothetical protein
MYPWYFLTDTTRYDCFPDETQGQKTVFTLSIYQLLRLSSPYYSYLVGLEARASVAMSAQPSPGSLSQSVSYHRGPTVRILTVEVPYFDGTRLGRVVEWRFAKSDQGGWEKRLARPQRLQGYDMAVQKRFFYVCGWWQDLFVLVATVMLYEGDQFSRATRDNAIDE